MLSREINHSETVAKEAEIEKLSASIKQLEIVISQNKLNLEKCKTENNRASAPNPDNVDNLDILRFCISKRI